ncbi:hypothetical protein FOA52_011629 [Chlamydomonas sp. UWO 241]|nr:hypothetical protein FOA52_011629 [Chlamydomonas sp. UWO 241]
MRIIVAALALALCTYASAQTTATAAKATSDAGVVAGLLETYGDSPADQARLRQQAEAVLAALASMMGNTSVAPDAAPATAATPVATAASPDLRAAPNVTAAQGSFYTQPEYPIGSGDNLIEFRKRVQALKEFYKEARTYLGVDDAVRIGGYITTLEKLGLDFVSAFPVAEWSFFLANWSLAASIVSVLQQSTYTAGRALSVVSSIQSLQNAAESYAATNPNNRQADGTDSVGLPASQTLLSVDVNTDALVTQLIGASTDLTTEMIPWALDGGPIGPMTLALDVMAVSADSLQRLSVWAPPAGLASSLGF